MLKLEFINATDSVNGTVITWRLRTSYGRMVAKSTEKWKNLAQAKLDTGRLFEEIEKDNFEVFDLTLTGLEETKSPAVPRKSRPRSSKAAKPPK